MDPQTVFCHNSDCCASGQIGKGNICIHSQKERLYKCTLCGKTFSERKGTIFHRRRVPVETIVLILTLVAYGCPIQAIVAAFGYQARTVKGWIEAAGQHCEAVHHELVVQPRDLGQVQADEIRVKVQGGIQWMAMAIMVPARLWLGGAINASRDRHLIRRLVEIIHACALQMPLLLAVDGCVTYVKTFLQAFRSPLREGKVGRPRLILWKEIVIGQVIKHYRQRRVYKVVRRVAHGSQQALEKLISLTPGQKVLNTAYIERLNGTFRARLAALVRRTRSLVRRQALLHAGMYLVGTVYNFCTFHGSLTRAGQKRTPAMAAGITSHRWSMAELLWHQVPPPPWRPPKRRGRPSNEVKALVERWAS